ncbi:MAG: HipA protein [Emergencia sp.]|nr:HipA protein [Emergencia sp.]
MDYSLMNKDRRILTFSTYKTEYGGTRARDIKVLEPDCLPVEYTGDIIRFIERRKAPKHRKYIQGILKQLGAEDVDGFIKVSRGASLTDTFWVRDDAAPLTWEQVSLYRNDFDENIARIAFEGGSGTLSTTTPELSVDGNYAKCWIRENNQLFLLKRGSESYGSEVFAEYYASQLAEVFCRASVKYDIVNRHGHLANKCSIFTSEEIGFSQMTNYVENPHTVWPKEALAVIEKYGREEDFRRMMVLDALILNIDRHLGNFGLLIDNDTLKPLGMAPVFDHNRSMLFNMDDERFMRQNMECLVDIYPRLMGEFNLNANDMLSDLIRSDLKNLSGFTFNPHGKYDWPEKRRKKYEKFLDRQIDRVLKREKLFVSRFE